MLRSFFRLVQRRGCGHFSGVQLACWFGKLRWRRASWQSNMLEAKEKRYPYAPGQYNKLPVLAERNCHMSACDALDSLWTWRGILTVDRDVPDQTCQISTSSFRGLQPIACWHVSRSSGGHYWPDLHKSTFFAPNFFLWRSFFFNFCFLSVLFAWCMKLC